MRNDKVYIAFLVIIALVLGVLVFVYFNISRQNGFGLGSSNNNNNTVVGNNSTTLPGNNQGGGNIGSITSLPVDPYERIPLGQVTNYTEFFNVNNIINVFYSLVAQKNNKSIINVFDPDFIKRNNITVNNISDFISTKYDEITFYAKTMYHKGQNGVRYYFVNGELQNYDFSIEALTEADNVNILVIIDFNNDCFSIVPINNGGDLYSYAQSYNINSNKKLTRNENNDYNEQRYTDEIIGINYIRYFQNMLYLNTEKAYDMLDAQTKERYPELKNFSDDLENVYNGITSRVQSYATKGEDGRRTYSIIMNNDKEIMFTEYSIMNFKVTLE